MFSLMDDFSWEFGGFAIVLMDDYFWEFGGCVMVGGAFEMVVGKIIWTQSM